MKTLHQNRYITAIVLTLLLTACTQKFQSVEATIKEAVFGREDANKSNQEISDLPYASSNVRVDDGVEVFVVLALAEPSPHENSQTLLKWLSGDHGMLVTQNGRIMKTLRLPTDNLAGITQNHKTDPLKAYGEKPEAAYWQATYDWQPDYRYGYTADIRWLYIKDEIITSTAWNKETRYYQEIVSFPKLDKEFTNHFWIDKKTHQVVESVQYIGPDMPQIKMTILKPFSG